MLGESLPFDADNTGSQNPAIGSAQIHEQYPFGPTPRNNAYVESFLTDLAQREEQFSSHLPPRIAELCRNRIAIANGQRGVENMMSFKFAENPDTLPDHYAKILNEGSGTIEDYLYIRAMLKLPSIETARFTMPYGIGSSCIPSMHSYVRDGVLRYNADAKLKAPDSFEKFEVSELALALNGVAAISIQARLNHGYVAEGMPIRAKELLVVRFDDDSSLANSTDKAERKLACDLRRTITDALRLMIKGPKLEDDEMNPWRDAAENHTNLKDLVLRNLQNEYKQLPDWHVPLSTTFYVSSNTDVKRMREAIDQEWQNRHLRADEVFPPQIITAEVVGSYFEETE